MHALVQWIEAIVVALAAAVFAHLGVAMKDAAPAPRAPAPVVQKLPVAMQSRVAVPHRICTLRKV